MHVQFPVLPVATDGIMEVDNVTQAVMQQWRLWSDMSFLDEDWDFGLNPDLLRGFHVF